MTVGRMHAFPWLLMRVMLGMATKDDGMISPAVLELGAGAGGAVHACRGLLAWTQTHPVLWLCGIFTN